jgi:hypothetical protein
MFKAPLFPAASVWYPHNPLIWVRKPNLRNLQKGKFNDKFQPCEVPGNAELIICQLD